jgi:hypothetical protein
MRPDVIASSIPIDAPRFSALLWPHGQFRTIGIQSNYGRVDAIPEPGSLDA